MRRTKFDNYEDTDCRLLLFDGQHCLNIPQHHAVPILSKLGSIQSGYLRMNASWLLTIQK